MQVLVNEDRMDRIDDATSHDNEGTKKKETDNNHDGPPLGLSDPCIISWDGGRVKKEKGDGCGG